MSTRGDILRRAAQVELDAVPEPWRASDDEDALATVSDREHYRKNLVTLPDGAGEVPAYVWDFPRTPTIPDEVREEWTRGSAGRVLNAQGQFVSRGSDVPRLSFDGDEAGLLVEAAGRTNHVRYSSDLSQWQNINATLGVSRNSIFPDDSAYGYDASGSSALDRFEQRSGLTTGNPETAYIIVEQETAAEVGMYVKDSTDGSGIEALRVSYNWSNDSFTIQRQDFGTINATYSRDLNAPHPNDDGALRVLVMRYTFDTSGNGREIGFNPDFTGSGDSTILHHAQIEEAPNASSPIVTNGSATTRAGDDYAIFEGGQPPWWNPNEGTFFAEYTDRRSNQQKSTLLHNGSSNQIIGISGGGLILTKDGAGTISAGSVNPFSKDKIAVSITKSGMNQSVNGSSVSGSHNGSLLSISSLGIDVFDNLIGSIGEITYYPRALSESTLNAITS